jgi:hypothetical protein
VEATQAATKGERSGDKRLGDNEELLKRSAAETKTKQSATRRGRRGEGGVSRSRAGLLGQQLSAQRAALSS